MKLKPLSQPDEGLDVRIRALERETGFLLPEDYIRFLHQMNGEKPLEHVTIELANTNTNFQLIYGSGENLPPALMLEYWLEDISTDSSFMPAELPLADQIFEFQRQS